MHNILSQFIRSNNKLRLNNRCLLVQAVQQSSQYFRKNWKILKIQMYVLIIYSWHICPLYQLLNKKYLFLTYVQNKIVQMFTHNIHELTHIVFSFRYALITFALDFDIQIQSTQSTFSILCIIVSSYLSETAVSNNSNKLTEQRILNKYQSA